MWDCIDQTCRRAPVKIRVHLDTGDTIDGANQPDDESDAYYVQGWRTDAATMSFVDGDVWLVIPVHRIVAIQGAPDETTET